MFCSGRAKKIIIVVKEENQKCKHPNMMFGSLWAPNVQMWAINHKWTTDMNEILPTLRKFDKRQLAGGNSR